MTLMCISLNDVKDSLATVSVQQDDQTHASFSVLPPGGLLEHEHALDDLVGLSVWQWWVEEDLNLRPHAYQACALTT